MNEYQQYDRVMTDDEDVEPPQKRTASWDDPVPPLQQSIATESLRRRVLLVVAAATATATAATITVTLLLAAAPGSCRWQCRFVQDDDGDNNSRSAPLLARLRICDLARSSSFSSSSSSPMRTTTPTDDDDDADNDNELIDHPRPPLHELISDFQTNVTGNVSWLLDFAILGHSKCATTIRVHWPETKLVVGVRHPVKWFESYYNYNKRQHDRGSPGATRLGPAELMNVPNHAVFHRHLHLLGKNANGTSDPDEHKLLAVGDGEPEGGPAVPPSPPPPPPYMRNKVFLYESTQPFDLHEGRSEQYRLDLAAFLDLSSPLPPIPLKGASDGDTYYNYTSDTYHYDIDVCENKYSSLRHELVAVGTSAAEWILRYFVIHPDVTVSSPRRFEELLRQWSVDPCEHGRD